MDLTDNAMSALRASVSRIPLPADVTRVSSSQGEMIYDQYVVSLV